MVKQTQEREKSPEERIAEIAQTLKNAIDDLVETTKGGNKLLYQGDTVRAITKAVEKSGAIKFVNPCYYGGGVVTEDNSERIKKANPGLITVELVDIHKEGKSIDGKKPGARIKFNYGGEEQILTLGIICEDVEPDRDIPKWDDATVEGLGFDPILCSEELSNMKEELEQIGPTAEELENWDLLESIK